MFRFITLSSLGLLLFSSSCFAQLRPPTHWDSFLAATPAWPIANIGPEIPQALIEHWRKQAFKCPATDGGAAFPSKDEENDKSNYPCDDGDANLFNGLLCLAGEEIGCDAVARAQAREPGIHQGQWYRSPNRKVMGIARCDAGESTVGVELYCRECINSFSPDHMLGTSLYLVVKKDAASGQLWLAWMDRNAQTTRVSRPDKSSYSMPWPRLCDLDSPSQQCIAISKNKKPGDVLGYQSGACFYLPTHIRDLDYLSDVVPLKLPPTTKAAVTESRLVLSALVPVPAVVLDDISAELGPANYVLHLEAVRVLLRMAVRNPSMKFESVPPVPSTATALSGPNDEATTEDPFVLHQRALSIASRHPWNPFYALLAYGPTPGTKKLIEAACPKQDATLSKRFDWLWLKEKLQTENSMGWDCVFVAQLYNKMRVRKDLLKEILEKFDPVNNALKDLQSAAASAQRRLDELKKVNDAADKVLSDARKTIADLDRAVIERLIKDLGDALPIAARVAGHARKVAKRSGDPIAKEAARHLTHHAEGISRRLEQAHRDIAALSKARQIAEDEERNQSQKLRNELYTKQSQLLAATRQQLGQTQSAYDRLNRNAGVWSKQ